MPTSVSEARTRRNDFNRLSVAWPVLGAFSLVLACVVLGMWFAGGVTSVDPGDDSMPTWQLVLMHAMEWIPVWRLRRDRLVGGSATPPSGTRAGVRWSLRDRCLLPELLGCHGQLLLFSFQYNAHHLNVGSWGAYIPGWHSPKPELWAVPIGFVLGAYTWAFLLAVVAGCRLLTYLRLRHPSWGPIRAFGLVLRLQYAPRSCRGERLPTHRGNREHQPIRAAHNLGRYSARLADLQSGSILIGLDHVDGPPMASDEMV